MLHYQIVGSGPLVVCLHGFLESSKMWKTIDWDKLGLQALLIDLPGHGKSSFSPLKDSPCLSYPVNEVFCLLNKLEIKEYNIIGHSLGGYISLELKKIDPRCKKNILLNSNYWTDNKEKKKDRIRVADIVFKSKNLFLKQAVPALFSNPKKNKKAIISLLDLASNYSSESMAYFSLAMRNRIDNSKNIDSNDFIIQGKKDPILNETLLNDCQKLYGNRLYIEERSGHMTLYENPSFIQNTIKEILID